jgi:hypothetical protein
MHVIGGMSMRINQKEQPTQLGRDSDYPSKLAWVATQFVAFHDVTDHRAWLVDGASALLHLVLLSLHFDETNPESTYDWVFDKSQLREHWDVASGRVAARRTLKDWEKLALPVYVKDIEHSEGTPVRIFATFGERVSKILHSLELLIDHQTHLMAGDGIKTSQTLDRRKGILGFDVFDLLIPRGLITSRTARYDSRGDGWIDLLPKVGVLSIFGNGFGRLIRPHNRSTVCAEWQDVPRGLDLLVSSVSTLKLLHELQLQRLQPGLISGQLTRELYWSSPSDPFVPCKCVRGKQADESVHRDPIQFVVSRSSLRTLLLKDSVPVDVRNIDPAGAVVFANLSYFGKHVMPVRLENNLPILTSGSTSNSGRASFATSTSASTVTPSSASTDPTDVSADTASRGQIEKTKDWRNMSAIKGKWAALMSLGKKN